MSSILQFLPVLSSTVVGATQQAVSGKQGKSTFEFGNRNVLPSKNIGSQKFCLNMRGQMNSIRRPTLLATTQAVHQTSALREKAIAHVEVNSYAASASPWKTLETLLWSDSHAGASARGKQHKEDAAMLENIFVKKASKTDKGRRVEVDELSQQTQALGLLMEGMQLKNSAAARQSAKDSWTRLFSDADSVELAAALRIREDDMGTAAMPSTASFFRYQGATWEQNPVVTFMDPHPIVSPMPAIDFQPLSIVRPQFPSPDVRPSLTPGVSEPGPIPEFRPFPNQPGTSPNIEVPTIAPSPTEIPTSTPTELPPSSTPSEVPSIVPPDFTPQDLPGREVDIPTRAPPIPLPNTPPLTPPGTPEPTPTPETTPIPPSGKPDPTPPPQTPPISPPGVPPSPPEVPPSGPPGFPGFRPSPGSPPSTPPPGSPGPEILPPGFGGSNQAYYESSMAPRAAMWSLEQVPAAPRVASPVLMERRPVRPVGNL